MVLVGNNMGSVGTNIGSLVGRINMGSVVTEVPPVGPNMGSVGINLGL